MIKKSLKEVSFEVLILISIALSLGMIAVIFVLLKGNGNAEIDEIAERVRTIHFLLPFSLLIGAIIYTYKKNFSLRDNSIKSYLWIGFLMFAGVIVSYPLGVLIFYIPASTIPSVFFGFEGDTLQRKQLSLLGWERFFFEWFWVSVSGAFLIILCIIRSKREKSKTLQNI